MYACEYKERDRQAERTRDRDRKGKKNLSESVEKILPENASGTLVSQRAGASLHRGYNSPSQIF